MPPSRRVFVITFVFGVVLVYAAVAAEIAQARYSLVSDYIAMANIHAGFWPRAIVVRLLDPAADGAWLYRPFADAVSWILGLALEKHVGAWHVLLIALRVVSAWISFSVARRLTDSVAAAASAAYFAFFPAIPEVDLTRVETLLIVSLAVAFYAYFRLARGDRSGGLIVALAAAFIAATMSKEVVAPVMLLLLGFAAPVLWRCWAAGRAALVVMSAAMLNEIVRFALLFAEPYAVRQEGGRLVALLHQGVWTAKVLLLATTNVPLVPLVLLAWLALGGWALWRDRGTVAIAVAVLFLLSVAMAVIAPYPALRYLSPAAFFMVPVLAMGIAESRRLVKVALADGVAYVTMLLFIVFGGAQMAAQAASMRNSTRADDALLRYAAGALASGRDVVMVEDYDFERAFWARAELAGIDPRYPFITYVAHQASHGEPIVWPKPIARPVNLTGAVPAAPAGRFTTARPPLRFAPQVLVIPANPDTRSIDANVAIEKTFDARDDTMTRSLARFEAAARRVNPRFHYLYDLGEWPYPGSAWTVFTAK